MAVGRGKPENPENANFGIFDRLWDRMDFLFDSYHRSEVFQGPENDSQASIMMSKLTPESISSLITIWLDSRRISLNMAYLPFNACPSYLVCHPDT